jgi:hypothetical protein
VVWQHHDSTVTAIDAKTGAVKGRLVLDERQRSETVRPLQPRELAVNEQTNTVYITGLGKESVIWVVDGATLKLKTPLPAPGQWRRAGDRSAGEASVYHQCRRRTADHRQREQQNSVAQKIAG